MHSLIAIRKEMHHHMHVCLSHFANCAAKLSLRDFYGPLRRDSSCPSNEVHSQEKHTLSLIFSRLTSAIVIQKTEHMGMKGSLLDTNPMGTGREKEES
jgi:hypothetical protein